MSRDQPVRDIQNGQNAQFSTTALDPSKSLESSATSFVPSKLQLKDAGFASAPNDLSVLQPPDPAQLRNRINDSIARQDEALPGDLNSNGDSATSSPSSVATFDMLPQPPGQTGSLLEMTPSSATVAREPVPFPPPFKTGPIGSTVDTQGIVRPPEIELETELRETSARFDTDAGDDSGDAIESYLIRTANAFGAEVVVVGKRHFSRGGATRRAQSTSVHRFYQLEEAIKFLRTRGCTLTGIEINRQTVSINEATFSGSTAF